MWYYVISTSSCSLFILQPEHYLNNHCGVMSVIKVYPPFITMEIEYLTHLKYLQHFNFKRY